MRARNERAEHEDDRYDRHQRSRLGDAGRFRPAARRSSREAEGRARTVGHGRRAGVRFRQHPLHDGHPHRHVGDRQAHPIQPADAQLRPDLVGLRICGQAPPAVQPLARRDNDRDGCRPERAARGREASAARERRASGNLDPSGSHAPGRGHRGGGGEEDQTRTGEVRPRRSASRCRRHRASHPVRAAARGDRRRRRAAGVHGCSPSEDRRRDPASHAGGVDGGCRVRRPLPIPPARCP